MLDIVIFMYELISAYKESCVCVSVFMCVYIHAYMWILPEETVLGFLSALYPSVEHRLVDNRCSFAPQGGLSAQAFVRVELEDVNDNRPVFNPSTYVTSISRQTPPGTEIINVLATDRDAGHFGAVAYALLPGELSSLFTIDSTTGR